MATFNTSIAGKFTFAIRNNSGTGIDYKITDVSAGKNTASGHLDPGQSKDGLGWEDTVQTLEEGSTVIVTIPGGVGAPTMRFWSGEEGPILKQYVNLNAENGYTVSQDTVDLSEVRGHGFRVTFDGGGANNPTTESFTIQVYNE